jgi:tripartite-type tricarboxylate transporter receptor subunit TctC
MTKSMIVKLGLVLSLVLLAGSAFAEYPDHTIHMIVPYPAGGSTDVAARIVSENMSKQLGVPIIIENRPGASGFIGAGAVARSEPDGYRLLFAGSGISSGPSLKEVTFDLRKDLTPISKVVSSQFSILVNPKKFNLKTLQEFLDYARANPGKVSMACSGAMTAAHFALEAFRQKAGLDFVTIQYSGNAPAQTAMMVGEPPAGIDAAFSAKEAVNAGLLRALAVTGSKRSPQMPDVPTAAEAGVPGYEGGFSLVMLAPGGTPKPIIDRIYKAVSSAMNDKALVERLQATGYEPVGNTPEEYAAQLEIEIQQSAKIIESLRAAGVVQ